MTTLPFGVLAARELPEERAEAGRTGGWTEERDGVCETGVGSRLTPSSTSASESSSSGALDGDTEAVAEAREAGPDVRNESNTAVLNSAFLFFPVLLDSASSGPGRPLLSRARFHSFRILLSTALPGVTGGGGGVSGRS